MQLGTGSTARLYRQLVDTNSDGSGNVTLTLWPKVTLANVQADNAPIVVNNTQGVFRLDDLVAFSADNAILYSHQFKATSLV